MTLPASPAAPATEPAPTEPSPTEPAEPTNEPTEPKPTETVEFWKQKAREQEKRAKENATAAQRLKDLEDSQKTEAEKAAERLAAAEATVATVPRMVADGLRAHLVALHQIPAEDAELFLTAGDPELLLKQIDRLVGRAKEAKKPGNHVPREGGNPPAHENDEVATARALFGGG